MATPAEQVRSITGLTLLELTDEDAAVLLELYDSNLTLASAHALEVFASTLVDVQSDDITLSGSKRAALLMSRAARLRLQAAADADDEGFTFDVVDSVHCRPELTERGCW